MFIYFACSITGGRNEEKIYQVIVDTLVLDGHQVPTAHLSRSDVTAMEEIVDPEEVYSRDIEWIDSCEALNNFRNISVMFVIAHNDEWVSIAGDHFGNAGSMFVQT